MIQSWSRAASPGSLQNLIHDLSNDELHALVAFSYDVRKKYRTAPREITFAAKLSLLVLEIELREDAEMQVPGSQPLLHCGSALCKINVCFLFFNFQLWCYEVLPRSTARFAFTTSRAPAAQNSPGEC